jgi:hypothetical protein
VSYKLLQTQCNEPEQMQQHDLMVLLLFVVAAQAQLDAGTAASGGSQRSIAPFNPGCAIASCSVCRAG